MIQKYRGEKFNPEIHISRLELEKHYSKLGQAITRTLRSEGVIASGMIIDRRPKGTVDVPFWEKYVVMPLLDAAFGRIDAPPQYKGQIVPARTPGKFKPLKLSHHRKADIEAAQPAMGITMGGIGNGAERQHGYSRGA